MVRLAGTTKTLTENHFSLSLQQWLPVAPQQGWDFRRASPLHAGPFSDLWSHRPCTCCCGVLRSTALFAQKTLLSCHPPYMALKVFLAPLRQWCLSFRRGCEIGVSFRAEHSAETSCRSLSITIYCKRKLLWWGLIGAVIYGLNSIDRSQFNTDLMDIPNEYAHLSTNERYTNISTNERKLTILSLRSGLPHLKWLSQASTTYLWILWPNFLINWIKFHCVNTPHFHSLFISWWISRLFSFFWQLGIRQQWTWMSKYHCRRNSRTCWVDA